MLIILEGPDASGKTTLAYNLRELLQREERGALVELHHRGPPTQHPLDEYLRPLTTYRPGGRHHVMLDRWHWGEMVYPFVRNRPTVFDAQGWHAVESYLERLGALVVRCTQYHDRYRAVLEERGEPLDELCELPEVEKHYRGVEWATRLPHIEFNWESPINGDLHRVLHAARVAEAEVRHLNSYVTYSGAPNPRYLLLGDTRILSKTARHEPYDPAFVPFARTSGSYLIRALQLAWASDDPKLTRVGIANACDVDDPYELWRTLNRPITVALGRRAQSVCGRLGITDAVVPHPQYVRRFHHDRKREYGRLIAQALEDRGDYGAWPSRSTPRPARTLTTRSSKASVGTDDAVRVATV